MSSNEFALFTPLSKQFDLIQSKNGILATQTCLEFYVQVLSKIVSDFSEPKWHFIRASSKILKSKVLSITGGIDLFVVTGFKMMVKDHEEFYRFTGTLDDATFALNWAQSKQNKISEKATKAAQQGTKMSKEEEEYQENLKKAVQAERQARYLKQVEKQKSSSDQTPATSEVSHQISEAPSQTIETSINTLEVPQQTFDVPRQNTAENFYY